MSYQKVSDGAKTFEHSGSMTLPEKKVEVNPILSKLPVRYEMPMSYVACPRCGNQDIQPICKCYPVNYGCPRCQWRHVTHDHEPQTPPGTPDYGGNVNNNSLLSGIIRK